MAGCVSQDTKKRVRSGSNTVENRTIAVKERLHNTAVSKQVGRWAVVVGISDYKFDTQWNSRIGIPDLNYAHRDAIAFANFLQSPSGGAFPRNHVILLTDSQATIKEMRKAIGDFLASSLEQDIVVIYFAGHGSPDPRNPKNMYLICHDTEPGNFYGTAFPMWDINTAIERTIQSKRVIVLADACHSAGVGGTRDTNSAALFNAYISKLATSREGVTKITASRSNELSMEKQFAGGGHGLFTYHLIKALEGGGDTNSDGFVTLDEAYTYLYDRVRSDSRHSQNPWVSSYVSTDIPLGIVNKDILEVVRTRMKSEPQQAVVKDNSKLNSFAEKDLPDDSMIAVKLAAAKLAKDEASLALAMVNAVIKRNDDVKPAALAQKIKILLAQKDLIQAENVEDFLVIPYPDHPEAAKGAKDILEYYIQSMEQKPDNEKIATLVTYLNRHQEGLVASDARQYLGQVKSDIQSGLEKSFSEQLLFAKGFARQNRFEKSYHAMDTAASMADGALQEYQIALDTAALSQIRLTVATREKEYQYKKIWDQFQIDTNSVSKEEKLMAFARFGSQHPENPYRQQAATQTSRMKEELRTNYQAQFDTLLSRSMAALDAEDFPTALDQLDKATDIFSRGRDDLSLDLKEKNLGSIRATYNEKAAIHRDALAWSKASYAAKEISLDRVNGFDDRIRVYQQFMTQWPDNPYTTNAATKITDLEKRKKIYKTDQFNRFFSKAQDAFVIKDYTQAYNFLEQATPFADSGKLSRITALAARYNAPPRVDILLDKESVYWETPVSFKYRASDQESDTVRVVSWSFGDGSESSLDQPEHRYEKWSGTDKARQFTLVLKVTDGFSTVQTQKTIVVEKQECVQKGDRFCKLTSGPVLDTTTGLMWASTDNGQNINWKDAKRYCETYSEGGFTDWRMPAIGELEALYDKNKGYKIRDFDYMAHITQLIRLTTPWPWASVKNGSKASNFDFDDGDRDWNLQSDSGNCRVLPVRVSK